MYEVYKGKDLVGFYENQNDLSAYFNKNLDDQDISIINDVGGKNNSSRNMLCVSFFASP